MGSLPRFSPEPCRYDVPFLVPQRLSFGVGQSRPRLGLGGKMDGVSGVDAPRLWAQGEFEVVLAYLAQDVVTTLEVAKTVDRLGSLTWISQRGSYQRVPFPSGWLPAREALKLPLPDTSWMSRPLSRKDSYRWTESNRY